MGRLIMRIADFWGFWGHKILRSSASSFARLTMPNSSITAEDLPIFSSKIIAQLPAEFRNEFRLGSKPTILGPDKISDTGLRVWRPKRVPRQARAFIAAAVEVLGVLASKNAYECLVHKNVFLDAKGQLVFQQHNYGSDEALEVPQPSSDFVKEFTNDYAKSGISAKLATAYAEHLVGILTASLKNMPEGTKLRQDQRQLLAYATGLDEHPHRDEVGQLMLLGTDPGTVYYPLAPLDYTGVTFMGTGLAFRTAVNDVVWHGPGTKHAFSSARLVNGKLKPRWALNFIVS